MITRIVSVIVCLFGVAWVIKSPGWDSWSFLIVAIAAYLGIEFAANKNERSSPQERQAEKSRTLKRKGKIKYKEEELVLVHILKNGAKEVGEIFEPLGLSRVRADFICHRLDENGFLELPAMWINRCPYYLTQKAREYIILKGLDK